MKKTVEMVPIRKLILHRGADGLMYDQDGYFVATGISLGHEDEDIDPDAPFEEDISDTI